jgi:hypothetical protein
VGVLPVAPCRRSTFTRRIIQRTGQQSGLPLRPRPMTAPWTEFLVGKGETDDSSSVEIRVGACEHIKAMAAHN